MQTSQTQRFYSSVQDVQPRPTRHGMAADRCLASEPIRMRVLDVALRRISEDKDRLEAQLAVVASLRAHGRPTEVAEMLMRAYQKFLKQSLDALAIAEVA